MTDALQSRRTFIKSAAVLGTIAAVGLTGGAAAANAAFQKSATGCAHR